MFLKLLKPADPQILFLPGLGGSEPAHWQSVWERELPRAHRIEQADWDAPVLDAWLHQAAEAVFAAPGSILVGHSLGAILIAHLAAEGLADAVAGALMVAPPDLDGDCVLTRRLASFAPVPRNPLPFPGVVIASTNDPHATLDWSHDWARDLGARFVSVGALGHINTVAGVGAWPEGRAWLDALVQGRPVTPRAAPRLHTGYL